MERPKPKEAPERENITTLRRYTGLYESLHGWCSNYGAEEAAPLSIEEVAQILANSAEARDATKFYLTYGEGRDLDYEVADSKREAVAWAIIDILANYR